MKEEFIGFKEFLPRKTKVVFILQQQQLLFYQKLKKSMCT